MRTLPHVPSTLRGWQLWLKMEIGITGGEEDGVDNSGVKTESSSPSLNRWDKLLQNLKKYFTPFYIQVYNVYKAENLNGTNVLGDNWPKA